jgi:hypothetical protein
MGWSQFFTTGELPGKDAAMAWNSAMAKKGGIGEDYRTVAVAGEF